MGVIIKLVNWPENMAQKGTGQACGDAPLSILQPGRSAAWGQSE